jgi:hypothetical protein
MKAPNDLALAMNFVRLKYQLYELSDPIAIGSICGFGEVILKPLLSFVKKKTAYPLGSS